MNIPTIVYAFIGGLIPALLWLAFWLREDRKHPEPQWLIIRTFIFGMASVALVIPLEQGVLNLGIPTFAVIILWSVIEELVKYGAAFFGGLNRKEMDEPIDALIYMITAALGFAAAENALFLFQPLLEGQVFVGLVTGNIRFIGATVLHIVASSAIGGALALSFYRRKEVKHHYTAFGIILATALHALFNSLIMKTNGNSMLLIFAGVWVVAVILLISFEYIKKIKRPKHIS